MFYQKILKPIFFKQDPESVHDRITALGEFLGKYKLTRNLIFSLFNYKNSKLKQEILGITFPNPVGLAAGFDKDARLLNIISAVGFGFEEIGSVTGEKCSGNPKPRLWRLPKYKSIVVNYGLKNEGCEAIAKKLKGSKFALPVGISVAKTNNKETCNPEIGISDYCKAFSTLEPYADYITINISCPNAYGGEPFTNPNLLEQLLSKIDKIKTSKPIFLKLSPNLDRSQIDEIITVCKQHNIKGFIISNLTKDRSNISEKDLQRIGSGGISGKPVEKDANKIISYVYKKTRGEFIIIGCGGIFSAMDAYEKIKCGASLVQLITGMIFQGPQLIKKINKDIVKLLEKDGYKNISEAVGSLHK